MCGTNSPSWEIDQKLGILSLNRYLFKCEKCECILSASIPDVTGFSRNPITTVGLAKALGGKKINTIYFKIDDVGSMQVTNIYRDKELV